MKLQAQWVVGFVDGEGCFHIGIAKHKTMKLGYQVLPEFIVTQHTKDEAVLYALKKYFQCGVIRTEKTSVSTYRVRNKDHLFQYIVPFFEKHSLKTAKKVDFLKFRKVILLMQKSMHLTEEGLTSIRKIKESSVCPSNQIKSDSIFLAG